MPIPEKAKVRNAEEVRLRILSRLEHGKTYWRPLHMRQDLWHSMYRLMDAVQLSKPARYKRFVSNEPHTAVDLAMSILTRNDAYWRIALFAEASENKEMQRLIGKVERMLQGVVHDIDEMFSMRLRMPFWKQAAFSALLRGYIWGKVHITTAATEYRGTPILAEIYDPRLVYPHTDAFGLNYVTIESQTTLGDLVNQWPDKFEKYETMSNYDPNTLATKIEYWSNNRGEKKGITAVLAAVHPAQDMIVTAYTNTNTAALHEWVIEPYEHGYTPEALPVVGVPVNGVNLLASPHVGGMVIERLNERAERLETPNSLHWWTGPNAHVADTGRSILASVEEHVPQYNELIAMVMHHLGLAAYGTWVFTTPNGEMPKAAFGIEGRIALTPEERVDRIEMGPINSEAFQLISLLGEEKQNGTLANILRAGSGFQGTGVLFQQMAQAALNSLEPFQDGLIEFGARIGTSILAQLQMAKSVIKPFEVTAPRTAGASKRQSLWVVEFDPNELTGIKRLSPRPVFKPSLPDDLAIRINAAKMALDPRRPILSLTTVLEHILQVEDPIDEIDRIWEDIATTDPVIVFEQIVAALERRGETEMAERIKEQSFRTEFLRDLEFRQQSGEEIPAPQPGGGMQSQAGAGQFTAQSQESQGFSSGESGGEVSVPPELGAMGVRAGEA